VADIYAARRRSEVLIAVGRLVLAAAGLLAVWLDPSEPSKYAEAAYTLLALYLGYAALIAAVVWASEVLTGKLALATHLIDLPIFTVFMFLTAGPTSPFFVYFVFSLFAGALRWQWRGVLWTALATLGAYIGLGVYAVDEFWDPAFQLNRFIIRGIYLALVAILLGYLSAYEQQLRREITKLAAWPRHVPDRSLLQEMLQHAADITRAPRILMLWQDTEEPWFFQATLFIDEFACTRIAGPNGSHLISDQLQDADFLCANVKSSRPSTLIATPRGLQRWHGTPLSSQFGNDLDIASVLSVRLRGENLDGRLFFLGKRALSIDDLVLAQIVARHITADLEQHYLQQRLREGAIADERVRFARELHDGVLQSLTGLALQLSAVQRVLETDPQAGGARLREIQDLLAAEQRDLRFFVQQIRPLPLSATDLNASLVSFLQDLCARIERQWGVRVELTVHLPAEPLSETLAHAVYRIIQEALANAARHGQATLAQVGLKVDGDQLRILLADNGRGFPFQGRFDLAALALLHQGPASLKQRVASLDGELIVESSAAGARLEIALPLRQQLQPVAPADIWTTRPADHHEHA
jgi:signal transduction histidine kinase